MASSALGKVEVLEEAAHKLGREALETVPLSSINEPAPEASKTLPSAPTCITQNSVPRNLETQDFSKLMVGLKNEVPRWKPGSVIRWTAWRAGYDSQEDADYAAFQLMRAAGAWNEASIGVSFEYVALYKDAQFVVCHGGDKGDVLASAYFPNQNDLNFVYVYTRAFQPDWKPNLWKVLTHELGHVLGLRHEFAMHPTQMFESGAVQIGQANPRSVMNYRREPPELQQSDIDSTKLFYSQPSDAYIGGMPIHDYEPM